MRRFARGKTDRQIASELRCRSDLIAAQRQLIMDKLEIRSQAQFAEAARRFIRWHEPIETPHGVEQDHDLR